MEILGILHFIENGKHEEAVACGFLADNTLFLSVDSAFFTACKRAKEYTLHTPDEKIYKLDKIQEANNKDILLIAFKIIHIPYAYPV